MPASRSQFPRPDNSGAACLPVGSVLISPFWTCDTGTPLTGRLGLAFNILFSSEAVRRALEALSGDRLSAIEQAPPAQARWRLTGNVGQAADDSVTGTLTHAGWKATRSQPPDRIGVDSDVEIVTPGEVGIT